MQNTTFNGPDMLPDNCPVRIKSGKYRNYYGTTASLPEPDGMQWVQLTPKGKEKARAAKFTAGQLADMRPLPALVLVPTQRAAL